MNTARPIAWGIAHHVGATLLPSSDDVLSIMPAAMCVLALILAVMFLIGMRHAHIVTAKALKSRQGGFGTVEGAKIAPASRTPAQDHVSAIRSGLKTLDGEPAMELDFKTGRLIFREHPCSFDF